MPPNIPGPSYNAMQMQAGMVPPAIQPTAPFGMHPGQVAGMLQQQAMTMQYVTPQPSQIFGGMPAYMPGFGGPSMPPPMMGGHAHLARQRAVHEQNQMLSLAQSGSGLMARLGGGLAAGMMGGPMGAMAFEAFGGGQALQRAAGGVFQPLVDMRERALNFQNQSTRFMVGGAGLSATGQGMSMMGSTQVTSGIGRMADSAQFRRETSGMFNRADLDRITRLSGELGMLDQSQNADQMIREVKKVSKALSNFMRLAEEPDIQRAMQQMSRLRTMGFTAMEMPTAAANARTFARMAGVSVTEAMAGAEKGAAVFQQQGLSGVAGFNAGLGSQGMARQLAGTMNARQLSMAGGLEGIQNTMLQASAGASTIDAFLPSMLTRSGGRLTIDQNAMREMLSGRMTPGDLARRGANNIRGLGGRQAIEELFTRRGELQDEMATSMTPQQQMLLPLLQARMTQRQIGGSMGAALMMQPGMTEQSARTLMQMASNPEFAQNMRQQLEASQQERMVAAREERRRRGTVRARFGRSIERGIEDPLSAMSERITRPFTEYLAEEQDRQEALEMQGEGPARIVRRDRLGTSVSAAGARDMLRRNPRQANDLARAALERAQTGAAGEDERAASVAQIPFARMFYGAQGFGITREARGGDTTRSAIIDSAGTGTQLRESLGLGAARSAADIQRLGQEQQELGSILRDQGGTARQRVDRSRAATRGLGLSSDADGARMLAAASGAVTDYVSSRRTLGGLIKKDASPAELRQRVSQSLRQRGFSEAQVSRAVNNQAFMAQAAATARETAGEEDSETFSQLEGAGQQTEAALAGQSSDQLQRVANEAREGAADSLGMNDYIDATDEEKRNVLKLVDGQGEEGELRRKLLAAILMSRSEDKATRDAGRQRMLELERSSDADAFARAKAAVMTEVNALSAGTREDMASRLEGKTSDQAETLMAAVGRQAQEAQGADIQRARQGVLGVRAGAAYTNAGGGAAGVRALRERPEQITDRNVKRMIDEGKSDEEIAEVIENGTRSRVRAGTETSAEGAGTSAGEREGMEGTEAMIAAISEGMEDFPGAVQRLDEASQKLSETADRLADAAGLARVTGNLEAGSGSSGGFFSNLFR
jgi:hypothetical protein